MYNKTTYYLFPLLYDSLLLRPSYLTNPEKNQFKLVNLYVSDSKKEPNFRLGDYLFLLLDVDDITSDNFIAFMRNIKRHKQYDSYYNLDYKKVVVIFKLNTYQKEITKHFLNGMYSYMDENYKESFKLDAAKKIDSVYNVLTRNPFLKKHIEMELNVQLDDDAELASIWEPTEEVINYTEFKNKFVNDILTNAYSPEREE